MKQETKEKLNPERIIYKVSILSIIVNISLSIGKLFAGIFGHSAAMVSDGIHSASDVFTTFIVIIGARLSYKQADEEHPYGHERLEYIAAIILSFILFLTGLGIGYSGLETIYTGEYKTLQTPALMALIAALISIILKEAMFWYTRYYANLIESGTLTADAWHHRSDALSSIGSFAGILGARMGFPILDPLASILICLMIIYAAWEIFYDAAEKLVDTSPDLKTINTIKDCVLAEKGVIKIDKLKARKFASKIYVDVEIEVSGSLSLHKAHEIAERVHNKVETTVPKVKHCMVHVNPDDCCTIDYGKNRN
jgi:cation diffusion facilitator family transporter